jgi:hypothetical protein
MYDGMIIVEREKLDPRKNVWTALAHVFRFAIPFLQVIIIHIISLFYCLYMVMLRKSFGSTFHLGVVRNFQNGEALHLIFQRSGLS